MELTIEEQLKFWKELAKNLHYALKEASIPKSVEARAFIDPFIRQYEESVKDTQ